MPSFPDCKVIRMWSLTKQNHLLKYGLEHPVRFIFLVALLIRIPIWLTISLFFDGHIFSDDLTYLNLVQGFGENGGAEWDEYRSWLWSRSLSFLLPAGLVTKVIGFHPIVILLGSVLVGSALAALLTLLLTRHVSREVVLGVGLVVAVMPSQVLWSSLLLKDSYIALGMATLTYVLVSKRKVDLSNYITSFVLIFLLLIFIQRIRVHTLMVVCIALVLTAVFSSEPRKILRTSFAVLMLALMPWLVNGDLGGVGYFETLTSGMDDQRLAGAAGANTAVVEVPNSNAPDASDASDASDSGTGNRLLDEVKYLPSGMKVMLLDPTVTQLNNSKSLYLPFAEHIIWYPALLLAIYGAVKIRKWSDDLIFMGFLFLGLSTMWALTEGNFGTAYRHRTEFVWIIFVFAAIGVQNVVNKLKDRKNAAELVSD